MYNHVPMFMCMSGTCRSCLSSGAWHYEEHLEVEGDVRFGAARVEVLGSLRVGCHELHGLIEVVDVDVVQACDKKASAS